MTVHSSQFTMYAHVQCTKKKRAPNFHIIMEIFTRMYANEMIFSIRNSSFSSYSQKSFYVRFEHFIRLLILWQICIWIPSSGLEFHMNICWARMEVIEKSGKWRTKLIMELCWVLRCYDVGCYISVRLCTMVDMPCECLLVSNHVNCIRNVSILAHFDSLFELVEYAKCEDVILGWKIQLIAFYQALLISLSFARCCSALAMDFNVEYKIFQAQCIRCFVKIQMWINRFSFFFLHL